MNAIRRVALATCRTIRLHGIIGRRRRSRLAELKLRALAGERRLAEMTGASAALPSDNDAGPGSP